MEGLRQLAAMQPPGGDWSGPLALRPTLSSSLPFCEPPQTIPLPTIAPFVPGQEYPGSKRNQPDNLLGNILFVVPQIEKVPSTGRLYLSLTVEINGFKGFGDMEGETDLRALGLPRITKIHGVLSRQPNGIHPRSQGRKRFFLFQLQIDRLDAKGSESSLRRPPTRKNR